MYFGHVHQLFELFQGQKSFKLYLIISSYGHNPHLIISRPPLFQVLYYFINKIPSFLVPLSSDFTFVAIFLLLSKWLIYFFLALFVLRAFYMIFSPNYGAPPLLFSSGATLPPFVNISGFFVLVLLFCYYFLISKDCWLIPLIFTTTTIIIALVRFFLFGIKALEF